MSASEMAVRQQPKFSVAITTSGYKNLINNTLGDPDRAKRFIAAITSAVAVNPALQECEAGTILAGALLGESLNLSPSPQLGQYYLVPFKSKAKYDRQGQVIQPETTKAQFILGYKGYIQLAIRSGHYKKLNGEIVFCDYCGRRAEYVDSKVIYGKSYGMIYLCRPCRAYVGVHAGTDKPKGRLADAELREWKKRAHAAFDPIWQYGPFRRRRNDAYGWLAEKMQLPREKTHIGMFDVEKCKQVIQIMETERSTNYV